MRAAVVAVLALLLCAGVRAQVTAEQCQNLFNAAGGLSGATRLLPACAPGDKYNAETCCSQVKNALNMAPQASQCLCNAQVWSQVSSQASSAGYGSTLADFVKTCGIKVAGSGC